MKKLIIAMILMLTSFTPIFADFTLADLFVSGGTNKPVQTQSEGVYVHDCQ